MNDLLVRFLFNENFEIRVISIFIDSRISFLFYLQRGESSSGGIGHKLGKGRNLEDTKRTEFGSLYVPDCRVLLKPPLAKQPV